MTEMVRVRMLQQMSGSRYDGRTWPGWGEEFDMPDWEAESAVTGGLVELVAPPAEVSRETRATPAPAETRETMPAPVRTARATSGQPRSPRVT